MIVATRTRRVALIGNPNTGKTTLFNGLTGLGLRVGNYPGVTVEKKVGRTRSGLEIVDLPGTYSLAAFAPDELIASRVLLGELDDEARPDLVVVVVDAGNLQRNLYLVTQVMETGIPVVVALNMTDLAEKAGITVDAPALSEALGVPVVPTIASRRDGLAELETTLARSLDAAAPGCPWTWPEALAGGARAVAGESDAPPFLVRRALIDEGGEAESALVARHGSPVAARLARTRVAIREETGVRAAVLEARMRYGWIGPTLSRCVSRRVVGTSLTDRLDAVLTHRVFGTLLFVALMSVMFMSIFEWAGPVMELIDGAFGALGELVAAAFAGTAAEGGVLQSFLVDGLVAGVGGVLVFLPQILVLFLFLALLEDCGYLARAAYLMDRVLRVFGLGGHSFIPLLSSFACAIPGVMAARSVSDRRDRLVTILVAPLMSCSARLPVYAILIAAFVPATVVLGFLPLQGLVFAAMYFLGIVVAVIVALLLKRTLLRGPASAFVMELPPYRRPSLRTVGRRVLDRGWAFTRRAGTIILAMSVIIWALAWFPRSEEVETRFAAERETVTASLHGEVLEARLAEIDDREAGAQLRQSLFGRIGRSIEPAVRPLGWDWRIGMAVVASFPAREVVVATLGITYDLGGEAEEDGLVGAFRAARWPDGRRVFDLAVALSLMVFFALCCQCGATVATIKRETNSWRWPAFAFGYMSVLAYVLALVTYQVASLAISA